MADTKRQAILDNVATTLAAITVANGYRTTITQVERVIREWSDVKAGNRPWLGFGPNPEAPESVIHAPSNRLDHELEIIIAGVVEAESGAAKTAAMSDLIDDLIKALYTDIRRGGNAISTMLLDLATDEIHPDTHNSDGGTAYLLSHWTVRYYRTNEGTA